MTDIIELEMLDNKVKVSIRNNEVSKTSIQTAFFLKGNEEISLAFLVDGQEVACGYDSPYFFLPDNWKTLKFVVKPFEPPRRLVDIEEMIATENQEKKNYDEESTKDIKWFRDLQKYALYYENSSNVIHCITPISPKLIATYVDKENRNLTVEITETTPVIIRNCYDANYRVPAKVVLRTESNLVVLQSIDTDFLEKDPITSYSEVGMRYITFGLPNTEFTSELLSPIVGHCTEIENVIRTVGSTKYSSNNIGAGVWNSRRELIGMVQPDKSATSAVFMSSSVVDYLAKSCLYYIDPLLGLRSYWYVK